MKSQQQLRKEFEFTVITSFGIKVRFILLPKAVSVSARNSIHAAWRMSIRNAGVPLLRTRYQRFFHICTSRKNKKINAEGKK